MNIKEQLKSIIVRKPAVKLDEDELCFFQADAQYGRQVEQITTTAKPGIGVGVGIPITNHIGIGIGKRKVKTKTTRELVWKKTKCTIMLTNSRFLVKMAKQVFQLDLNTFQSVQLHKDAITIVSIGNSYTFFMNYKDLKRFDLNWKIIGEAGRQGINVRDLI